MLLCPCPPGHPQPQGLTRGGDVSPGDGGLWFPRGQAHQGHIGALVHDDVAGDPEYLGRHCKETGTGVRELLLGVPGSPSGLKHRQGLKGNSAEPPSGGTALPPRSRNSALASKRHNQKAAISSLCAKLGEFPGRWMLLLKGRLSSLLALCKEDKIRFFWYF